MKSVLALGLVVVATALVSVSAQAANRRELRRIESVNFDGTNLTVGYQVGGGCAEHTGEIELTVDEAASTVTVKVFDVTDKYDACEAILYPEVTIDLKTQTQALLKAKGVTLGSMKLILPEVSVRTY